MFSQRGWQFPLLATCLAIVSADTLRAEIFRLNDDEQRAVNESIDRGVSYLKRIQNPQGFWGTQKYLVGHTAMVGLALVECGVPPQDPSLVKAANYVRSKLEKLSNTYELSLCILFFDALNHAGGQGKQAMAFDALWIRKLAMRLIAGQKHTGGWYYGCPVLKPEEENLLANILFQYQLAAAGKPIPPQRAVPPLLIQQAAQKWPVLLDFSRLPWVEDDNTKTDNSCTHFVILALWRAQRHNVPLQRTMDLLVRRFRNSQNSDGGWGYRFKTGGSSPQMTAVGLMGMAVGIGLGEEADVQIEVKEKEYLPLQYAKRSWCIKTAEGIAPDQKLGSVTPEDQKRIIKGFTRLRQNIGTPAGKMRDLKMQNLYYLWALERCAVLYNLPAIGDKDWYRWAAEVLVANQKLSGGWEGKCGYHGEEPDINTAMAIMILKRANLATDLTRKLPFSPGELIKEINVAVDNQPKPKPDTKPKPTPPQPQPEPTPIAKKTENPPPPPPPLPTKPEPTPVDDVKTAKSEGGGKTILGVLLGLVALLLLGGVGAFIFITKRNGNGHGEDRPKKKRKKRSDD